MNILDIGEIFLKQRLAKRKADNTFRNLFLTENLVDFSSNDYLGFARSEELRNNIIKKYEAIKYPLNGSTGSRLISGNSSFTEELERKIAAFHRAEAGLIFNSGYDANVGLLASLGQKGDTYLSDELIHASMIDGIRLSYAEKTRFRHNDLKDLEEKLCAASGTVFVCVESLYSMDGDFAPLKEMTALCEKYQAHLIVDEAHATGVFGEKGRGLICKQGLEEKVFARIHTFGKALGTHGAIVLGSEYLKEYLINFARTFIYTTALPLHSLLGIESAYEILEQTDFPDKQKQLQKRIAYFKELIKSTNFCLLPSQSPIQSILIPRNEAVKKAENHLKEKGFFVKAIVSPTIAQGAERLRICLHSFNTEKEIEGLEEHLEGIIK